jgi:hypothetical protein
MPQPTLWHGMLRWSEIADQEGSADVGEPEAGPARPPARVAYLPPRAARARKLILRSQLGLPWLLGAIAVAAVILVAGIILLLGSGNPGAPWARLEVAARFPEGAVTQSAGPAGTVAVVDRRAEVRVFLTAPGPCPVDGDGAGFVRSCDGAAWDADGRPRGEGKRSGTPLRRVPARLHDGSIWIDPS